MTEGTSAGCEVPLYNCFSFIHLIFVICVWPSKPMDCAEAPSPKAWAWPLGWGSCLSLLHLMWKMLQWTRWQLIVHNLTQMNKERMVKYYINKWSCRKTILWRDLFIFSLSEKIKYNVHLWEVEFRSWMGLLSVSRLIMIRCCTQMRFLLATWCWEILDLLSGDIWM